MNESNIGSSSYKDQQTLNNIQALQNNEQDLFIELEKNIANKTLTDELQKKLTSQIKNLTDMRVNLYGFLNNNSRNVIGNLESSNSLLSQQKQTVDIVENELNESKKRIRELNEIKTNNLRMVEINKYYGDKYQDQTYFMMTIVTICIVLIIIKFLHNRRVLPDFLYGILLIVVLTTAFIIVFWKMIYLYSRDKFDYSKYKWSFNTANAPVVDTSNPDGNNPWKLPEISDYEICNEPNSYCGTGTTYDSTQNMCVPSRSTTSISPAAITTDSFIDGDYSYETLMNQLGY
jgi:hypothetical protein